MILTSNEWAKIKAAAALYWPDAALDTQMSRQEASRRLLLSGIDQLRQVAQAERQVGVAAYAQSLQPPADKMQPTLTGIWTEAMAPITKSSPRHHLLS
jgi:hypothetical protein